MSDILSLEGRDVLVTGAAGAIGAAICTLMRDKGANVIGADRVAADGIRELDVTEEQSWDALAADIFEETGKLNVLVNCAGVAPMGRIDDLDIGEWRRAMAVNVEGVALGLKVCLPLLKAASQSSSPNGASIINIASAASRRPAAMSAAYCASKAAVAMLTKVAASEFAMLGYNVRVNSVHPGVVASPMMDDILAKYADTSGQSVDDLKAGILQSYLVKRFATPEEVAAATLYLAGDAATYLNGAEQLVDGGYLTT